MDKKVALAGLCGIVTGLAVASLLGHRRRNDQAQEVSSQSADEEGSRSLPEHIKSEVWSRNVSFFGDESFGLIRESFVVVVGLGGVGSHAAHMLARSGVGALRLVDFDQAKIK